MKTTTQKLWAAPSEIARNDEQPRLYFDAEELNKLGASLARKQQQPVTVIAHSDPKRPKVKWKIVDGERRWRAAQQVKLERLWIVVDDDVADEQALHTASFAANWCRAGHTHAETAKAIDREYRGGRTYAEIAALVGKTDAWASNEHSLLLLDPEVLKLLDPPTPKEKRIPTSIAFLLVKYPKEKQMRLWLQHKSKPRGEAFHHIRVAAPTQANRRPSDDVSYIVGRASAVCGMVKGIARLPSAMIGRLNAEQRGKVAAALREAAEKANETAELITAAVDHDDEE